MTTPEANARIEIDAALAAAGWLVQNRDEMNIHAGPGVAVREFGLKQGHGTADYLLYADQQAVGVVEAKKIGETLTGVEVQSEKYSTGLPDPVPAPHKPLPFLYQSTGVETRFTNELDPDARSRGVFAFHRPRTLARWAGLSDAAGSVSVPKAAEAPTPYGVATLRSRLRELPELKDANLWTAQRTAINNLEKSFAENWPRALIQMATGSGKTYTAISSIYRLVKFAGAQRILFIVDRGNLAKQAEKEFQSFVTPDDGRKFTELYIVQRLTTNKIDPTAKVVITTIQRLYSILQGNEEYLEENEEMSHFEARSGLDALRSEPQPVVYNPAYPIEFFDFVFIDECHRSIFGLWRQVVEYFDAFLIGLTATPSAQSLGFFDQNLVMEYGHAEAVADGVNVDYHVYRIRTKITEQGSTVDAGQEVQYREKETRKTRWARLDEDLEYSASQLDRDVVSKDQIRTVVQTFRDRLPVDIFPGRVEVPKTLIYAKDDNHADEIVQMVREQFAKGNNFCEKITYKSNTARIVTLDDDGNEIVEYKSSNVTAEDHIQSFRNSYNPRIAVTVDMIATGTDIKPLEIVMFMRMVRSRNFFEQMKGRGVRIIDPTDLKAVTSDSPGKDHFVIVDCVGVTEDPLINDTAPLERKPSVSLEQLLQFVSTGATDEDVTSTLASRIARLDRQISPSQRERIERLAEAPVIDLVHALVDAVDADRQTEHARVKYGIEGDAEPTESQLAVAAQGLMSAALKPLVSSPDLRSELVQIRRDLEQTIDHVSQDEVIEASSSVEATERAHEVTSSFREFLEDNKDEITALQVLYSRPYAQRLTVKELRELAEALQKPPRSWTTERLWQAYEALDKSKVRGSGPRVLTDVVSLVRFALEQNQELVPFRDEVDAQFERWLAAQETAGRTFTPEQRRWLEMIKDHVAGNLTISMDDFDLAPFAQEGGTGKVYQLFGSDLSGVLEELTAELLN